LEYALPLLRGGTLVLTDIENAGAVLEKHGELTLIQQTPSVYRSLLLSLDSQVFPNITCLVGGEALDNELLSRLQQTFGRVINVYGPTETVIWSCSYDCTKATNALIIGRPLKNEKCYLLDDNMQPVPPGVVGELHIGGAGVAKGYLNRPELTAERFVENPFTTVQDKQLGYYRLYKTGDLVKMGFDGNIEYIGRSDFQVKINGHRIEVGEIEVQIADFSDITQVLVVVHNHNQQDHLIAYFVADSEVDHDRLTQYLYSKLPDYMMPSAFMQLAAFVLSTNGKLDRKALPRPKFVQQGYVAPQNTLETQLCQLWQEILDVPQVGVTDDFFKLGGNSILAINLVNRIRGQLDIELSLADLFEYNRIRPLIEHGLARQAIRIEPFECERYPLSYAQQRLWFIEQFDQGTAAYQIPILLKLGGTDKPANNEAAEEALRAVIDRHQVLRTCIGEDRSGFHQQIQPLSALNVATIHCEQEKFETVLAQTWQQGFDLTVDIPLRAHFIITENEQYLLINIHHIAFDGWSIELFMAELDAFYSYYDQQSPLKLAELPIQYKDFAVWQRRHLADGESERQLAYWATQLEDLGQMQLCSDFTRPVQIDFSGAHVCRTMDISTSIGLVELAKTQGVSLNTLMLSAFYLLLYKHSGQSDLVIGTPVANRHLHGIENLVGFFVNTLTLRVQVNKNSRFSEFLKRTGEVSHQAQNHQDVPFESVVEKLDQDHDASRHPLFQVMFALQNFGEEATDSDWYTHAQELLEQPFAKYDLSVVVANKGGQLVCTMNYATALFEQQTISTLLDHYFNLLGQIVCDIEQPLSAYQVLDKTQYIQLVNLPVASLAGNDQSMRLETRFEAHALATPDAIAIVTEHQQISYQDLNRQANQLAHFICSRCQFSTEQPELVAILLDSCADLIVAQLAILKTGAAFVPIDVRNPTERVKYILSDTQSPLVITHTRHQHLLQGIDSCEVVFLDLQPHQNQPDSHLMLHLFDTDLAYVIYTSGTTGRPKGVMIEHRQIGSTLEVQSKTYGITADAAFYLGISPAFDACVAVIYGALRNGGRLLITDGVDFSAPLVRQTTHLIVAASLLESLQPNWLPKLQCLVYGADKASQAVLNKFSYADIYVEYGVTEAAIASTHKQMRVGDTPTIGKPMANSQVYILDDDLQPVPFGCIGELYICGAGVARGYMNLKEQTKSSFIDNPFIKNVNDTKLAAIHRRLYKTGDLVRYCRNGEIEFHGRNDSQVKLRGLRIELGEISAALESLAGIDRAEVIVCRLNGVDTLVAYYVADAALADQWLDDQLKQLLPGYMQPATCIHLNELPLTLNGKLDVTRLPEPQLVNSDRVAPQNPLQQQLFDIWHSLLGHDDFGVEDDFFTIGGDSILVIQLSSRVKKDGYMLNVKEIFTHRTIAQQCLSITAANQHVEVVTEQGLLQSTFGLLPIQQWFFDQHKAGQIGNLHHWNQSFLLRIPAMGVDRLQAMLAELVAHHDMLRVTFKEYGEGNGGGTVQQYHDDFVMPPVQSLDVSQLTDNALELQLDKWQADFDIFNGPLFRFAYLHGYDDGVSRLYFACHHLLIDAVSWRILIEDLHGLVEAQPLVDKTSSYRQWTEFMTNYGDNYAHECVYWDGLLKCLPQYPSQKLNDNDTVATVVLDRPTSAGLINQANRAYKSSINDLLLTALAVALKGWNNELIQGVCLEGHGRENLCDEIDHSRTVGWFTSYLPVALYLFEDSNRLENVKIDLAKSIAFNKELLRQIPNNGIGFSTLAQGIDNGAKIPPISFNYLGQLVSEEALWQLASESSGENNAPNNRLPYLIAINGAMVDKQLKFSVTTRLGQQVSQQLADDFAQALVSITEHCLAKINDNQRQLSVSDLTNYKPYEICHPQAKDPWFIMPPADAGAETYFANLVQSMPDKRLVLFNNLYRQLCEESAEQARDIDFSVLAMQTITMIKSIQPSGPYQLLGWSFGGVLALEIARQLVANGDKVEKLLLVDAYFNYQKVFHASPVLQQLQGDAPIVDDINYRYQPGKGLFSNDCEVVLFKAQQKSVKYQDEAFDSVENSYLATHDNHLGDFVMPTSLTVVPLECGHYDCFEQPQIVAEICEQMQVLSLEVV
jgi:amino acid adenylation domain-containing protein/non-ribosomal peptide synthase protein (TIGR01720 family)